jgi:hypothetical protein
VRHRRNTLTPGRLRKLRATAAVPCVTAVVVAALTGAASAPDSPADAPRAFSVVHAEEDTTPKWPDDQGTSDDGPAPLAPSRPDGHGAPGNEGAGEEGGAAVLGTEDLYEPGPVTDGDGSLPAAQRPATTAATGEVSPVLPLGAGMTLIGLGLALIALRLRHA